MSTSVVRVHNGVAPPVPATRRRNISSKANGVEQTNKRRPRPRSNSDEDSRDDPSPPGSPIPLNLDDADVPIC